MKSILVTGGAGFIGSHLCEKILKDKRIKRLTCVDNLDPVYNISYKLENLAPFKKDKRFRFSKIDIRDKKTLEKIFRKEKPEYVINLAAKTDTRISVQEPQEYIEVNISGVLNLLELSKVFHVKGMMIFSSSSVYGNSKVKPPLKETVVSDFPLSPYAATKKAGEVLAYTYYYNHSLPVTCLRFFNVYGERMRQGLVLSKWVENILNNKAIEISSTFEIRRDFTYVSDVVDAIMLALKKIKGYEIFNIASSNPASLTELLKVVEKTLGIKAVVIKRASNKASISLSHADITKTKRLLGWKPKVSLEKGVSNYVKWFRQNRFKNR